MTINYWIYFLITGRFLGAMIICPLFSEGLFPRMLKMILALLFALIVVPRFWEVAVPDNDILCMALLAKEILIGALMSYLFSFPLWLVENIGNIIDLQRGEQFGAVVNQLTKDPASSISKLLFQGFMAYFVSVGGIVFFIKLVAMSFLIVAPTDFFPHLVSADVVISAFAQYFYWLVVLALPVVFAMYLLELILGLFSTFIQQLNVTVLSMPLKSILAIFILIIYLGSLYHFVILRFVNENMLSIFKG